MTPPVRRALFGPVQVTSALAALAMVLSAVVATATVVTAVPLVRDGWLLTWLLLGLTAGYALSGST